MPTSLFVLDDITRCNNDGMRRHIHAAPIVIAQGHSSHLKFMHQYSYALHFSLDYVFILLDDDEQR